MVATQRFALNYKGLPVKTEWVEYPDIKELYHTLGLTATEKRDDGSPYYCLPIIYDPSTNTTLCESFSIVQYLEKTYPNTPTVLSKGTLALQKGFLVAFRAKVHWPTFHLVIFPIWLILNEPSQAYFRTTREADFGQKLEDIGTEERWQKAETAWNELAEWFKLDGEGSTDFVMGKQLCFVDLQIVSVLVWARNGLGENSEEWKRICSWGGGKWKRYLESFSKYEVVDA